MNISAIVAIDKHRGMGKHGGIPWHIPGEQKRFKEITTPHPMIMGRKTFESIGRILPGRPHIIVTRDTLYQVEGAAVVHSVAEAIQKAKEMEEHRVIASKAKQSHEIATKASPLTIANDELEIFVIGGGEIFKEAMPQLTRLYLTLIDADFHCDTFFPDYAIFTKIIEKEEKHDWEHSYTYLTLEK